MIGAQARELELGDADRPPARRELVSLLQHRCGRLGDSRPGERRADPPSLGPRGREGLRLLEVVANRVGKRCGVVEGHESAGA